MHLRTLPFLLLALALAVSSLRAAEQPTYDLVIYGGTSAGIAAAVQAKRMGRSVVVVEPTRRVGGLTTGGLGATDIGNKAVIGGIAREFYVAVKRHYDSPAAWTWQTREEYRRNDRRTAAEDDAMWTFEPATALKIYHDWIREHQIEVVYNERLDRGAGVGLTRSIPWRILSIRMESGRTFRGRMFIDATYEGDLMAAARVSYTVGREANATFAETLNGVQTAQGRYHQFVRGVDPYKKKGDPASGLLPFIDPQGPGKEGEGDKRVQAYCYRMCLTDHPQNRIPFAKPADYNEQWYELLLRNYEAGETGLPWINTPMPNRKTDTNNRLGFSTDFIGENYAYPEASYAERAAIAARHRRYQEGLMWTLAYHPRMPEKIRAEISRWGMTKDEFPDGQGWQEQLYVREARRMIADLVMTQHHCQQREKVADSVGMGAYTMDSHHVQRYVDANGHVRNEGDVQVGGFPPYPVGYGSIVPKRNECTNLLVPVCLSASHIAYGSIRMEPVFMVLGQSAATAAVLAIDGGTAVQDVPYEKLRTRLVADRQILDYLLPARPAGKGGANSAPRSQFDGVLVDDSEAAMSGAWSPSHLGGGIHAGYRHDGAARDGRASAVFTALLPAPGEYDVQVAWTRNANRATKVPVTITHAGGTREVTVNQREQPPIGGHFASVGRYRFGATASVTITNAGTDGHVIIDAVRFVPVR